MARPKQNDPVSNELPDQEPSTAVIENEEMGISFEEEVRTRLDELNNGLTELTTTVTDHDLRLYKLGDDAKPLPLELIKDINLSKLFIETYSQVMAQTLMRFYDTSVNDQTLDAYIQMAMRASIRSVEQVAARYVNSHNQ